LQDALVSTYASAYHDRADRIKAKEQILDAMLNDEKPTHPVVRSIFHDTQEFNVEETLVKSISEDWYLQDELMMNELSEFQSNEATRLNQDQWTQRFTAFHIAHSNLSGAESRKAVKNLFKKAFDLGPKQGTKRFEEYVERYDVNFEHPVIAADLEVFNPSSVASEDVVDTVQMTENAAKFVDKIFKYVEEMQDGDRIHLPVIGNTLYDCGLIDNAKPETVQNYIKMLDNEVGLTHYKYIDRGTAYLSTYIH